jgi:hypothetical protein
VTSRRIITMLLMVLATAAAVGLFVATGADAYAVGLPAAPPSETASISTVDSTATVIRWSLFGVTALATLILTLSPRLGRSAKD